MNPSIIVATHGRFGAAMLQAAEGMLGPQESCTALFLEPGMGIEDLIWQMHQAADNGEALFLVDMLGGTPWNAAVSLGLPQNHEVIAPLSLPLLLEALLSRQGLPARALGSLLRGKSGLSLASQMLKGAA
jgi:mannose/fructose/sorbose-specific phosphotransferase system IIA component